MMLKRARNSLKPHLRNLHNQASTSAPGFRRSIRAYPGAVVSSTLVAAYIIWYTSARTVHSDASSQVTAGKNMRSLPVSGADVTDSEDLRAVVWGSNRSKTLSPLAGDVIRTPSVAHWLDGVALRDLALHKDHAACVDARGDVYQWGTGFTGSNAEKDGTKPAVTLRGKNITQLQLTESRLYALSASGKVYALSTNAVKQELRAGAPTPSSDPWWGTGWLWGEDETVDFIEVVPKEQLARGEKFTSIAAGNDHLLAVTSKGRSYAHPVNKQANAYGQLGFRKFDIPDPSSHRSKSLSHMEVELIPKNIADPYAKSSRFSRVSPVSAVSDNLSSIDDSSIRFCPNLFEIPILRGVEVAQVAAGGRNSFIRTVGGRVLGWGANEYGQIGLGSNVVLEAITVPTEVILWRNVPTQIRSRCLNISAGGDLTAFTVERSEDSSSSTTIDLLLCGNGQWGGLGGNSYSNAQSTPLRAKNVSGLVEYSDATKSLQPIAPHAITISPTGHVLLTLDTSSGVGVGGRDLVVWGKNYESELGNGKKSSLAVPTALDGPEEGRFMLRTREAREVRDLRGRVWGRGVGVEQCAVAGYGSSAVYWRLGGV